MVVFDTDIISALMRRAHHERLYQRLMRMRPDQQATTAITLGEVSYGAARVGRPDLLARAQLLFAEMTVLPFDEPAAEVYGPLRSKLEKRGFKLAEADLRIAAIAMCGGHMLVTANIRHFARVDDLRVENWLEK